MDSGIIFALVLAAMFFGGLTWLVIYSNRQPQQTDTNEASSKPSKELSKKRAA